MYVDPMRVYLGQSLLYFEGMIIPEHCEPHPTYTN